MNERLAEKYIDSRRLIASYKIWKALKQDKRLAG